MVSRAFFSGEGIEVHGLPWCKDKPKRVGMDAAVARHLCRRHNSMLSPLDTVAGHFANAMRRHVSLCREMEAGASAPADPIVLPVNARGLERWLLKTLVNLCVGGRYRIGIDSLESGRPGPRIVELVFGRRLFEERSGMYVAAYEGMQIETVEKVSFSPLIHLDQVVVGGFFTMFGLRFVLITMPEGMPVPLSSIPSLDEAWRRADLKWRFEEINVTKGEALAHKIRFQWS